MAKVHPNSVAVVPDQPAAASTASNTCSAASPAAAKKDQEDPPPTVLTVWRKSLLFNCDGFTVFDAKGDLAFRVDCYGTTGARGRAEVVLMDVAGKPLLTVRRKRPLCSLADHWAIYDGDAAASSSKKTGSSSVVRPLLTVRRHVSGSLGRRASSSSTTKALAHVTSSAEAGEASPSSSYVVEGSYGRRACAVRDANGDAVAEVRRKESVGDDVFRLVVAGPRLGAPLAMGLVIALDEMFRGSSARSLLRRTWSA